MENENNENENKKIPINLSIKYYSKDESFRIKKSQQSRARSRCFYTSDKSKIELEWLRK